MTEVETKENPGAGAYLDLKCDGIDRLVSALHSQGEPFVDDATQALRARAHCAKYGDAVVQDGEEFRFQCRILSFAHLSFYKKNS